MRYLFAALIVAVALTACQPDHPVLMCIKANESASAGLYLAENPRSSASGAYQWLDSTWRSMTRQFGYGTEYARASHAPGHVQEMVAYWAIINPGKHRSHWSGANSRCFR